MEKKEKAWELVNEKFYQPLTIHLNLNNNSQQMWDYAKRCALICVEEILTIIKGKEGQWNINVYWMNERFYGYGPCLEYWQSVKTEIENL